MKYAFLILLCSLGFQNSFGRSIQDVDKVKVLETLLNDSTIIKYLRLSKHQDGILNIIDTNNYFVACNGKIVNNRKILIFNNSDDKLESQPTTIIIFKVEKRSSILTIYIGYKPDKKYGFVKLKINKDKYHIIKYQLGQV